MIITWDVVVFILFVHRQLLFLLESCDQGSIAGGEGGGGRHLNNMKCHHFGDLISREGNLSVGRKGMKVEVLSILISCSVWL